MNINHKHLQYFLYLIAVTLILATFTVFLPTSWMIATHEFLGLGTFPNSPLTQYLTRSISALYAIHGMLIFSIAIQIKRNWHLVPAIGFTHLFFGIVVCGVGFTAPLPWYWRLAEGPSIAFAGLLILLAWRQISTQAKNVNASSPS